MQTVMLTEAFAVIRTVANSEILLTNLQRT